MNAKYLLPTGLGLACIWLACNKEKPKQYSYWTINGQKYSSNNVAATEGHNRPLSVLSCHDSIRFDLHFMQGYLPTEGSWALATLSSSNDPSNAILGFYFGPTPYIVSEHNTNHLEASVYNDKARYSLAPTWFINFHHPTADSILIEGTFNEP